MGWGRAGTGDWKINRRRKLCWLLSWRLGLEVGGHLQVLIKRYEPTHTSACRVRFLIPLEDTRYLPSRALTSQCLSVLFPLYTMPFPAVPLIKLLLMSQGSTQISLPLNPSVFECSTPPLGSLNMSGTFILGRPVL